MDLIFALILLVIVGGILMLPVWGIAVLLTRVFTSLFSISIFLIASSILSLLMLGYVADFWLDYVALFFMVTGPIYVIMNIAIYKNKEVFDLVKVSETCSKNWREIRTYIFLAFVSIFVFWYFQVWSVDLGNNPYSKGFDTILAELASWFFFFVYVGGLGAAINNIKIVENVFGSLKKVVELEKFKKYDLIFSSSVRELDLKDDALSDAQKMFDEFLEVFVGNKKITDIFLGDSRWLTSFNYFHEIVKGFEENFLQEERIKIENSMLEEFSKELSLTPSAVNELLTAKLDIGELMRFDDGEYLVTYKGLKVVNVCACCGHAELTEHMDMESNWYCSDLCRKVEDVCLEIKKMQFSDFIKKSSSDGFVLMQGAQNYQQQHKVVTPYSSTGHGFAAEEANTTVDKLKGNNAEVVGGDNAKHGADRLVNGVEFQTKYLKTARRSVGAAFDGQNGEYKYFQKDGSIMPVEVPKDQFDDAVKVMEEKIRKGNVPGVTDPKKAKDLVVKGHLTYSQAVNVTKFGTFESVAYDVSTGAITSVIAGGISFGLTAVISYVGSGDKKRALQAALLESGKTFTSSMMVHVTTQQLHRLTVVNNAVSFVNVKMFGPSAEKALIKGIGASGTKNATQVLRGSVVTAAAMIVVKTGPDLLKLTRGRVSSGQFWSNFSITTTGTVTATIGAILGGMMAAPLGPVGIFVGQATGGALAGAVGSMIAGSVAKNLVKQDVEIVMEYVSFQLEYLCTHYYLNQNEIECVNENLKKSLNQNEIEIIFAAQTHSNRRATANFYLKPIVVSVIKQRKSFFYTDAEVVSAAEEMVEFKGT